MKKIIVLIVTFCFCMLFSSIIFFDNIKNLSNDEVIELNSNYQNNNESFGHLVSNEYNKTKPIETMFIPKQIEYIPPTMYDYMLEDDKNIIKDEDKINEIISLFNSYEYEYIGQSYEPNFEKDGISCLFIMSEMNNDPNSFCSVVVLNDIIGFDGKYYRVNGNNVNTQFFDILNN